MADESSVAAGQRFAHDMKRIREARELSVDDLHKETRIARSLIHSFEEGGLYDHSTFNEVYLRSFVRAYAEAVGISAEAALDGLDAALADDYEDALARRYLQSASPEDAAEASAPDDGEDAADAPPQAPVAGGPEGRGGLVGPPRALGEEGPSIGDEASEEADSGGADDREGADDRTPAADEAAEEAGEASDTAAPSEPEAAAQSSPEAAGQQTPEREDPEGDRRRDETEATPEEEDADASTPTEDDEESLDVRPEWMDEEPDGDEEAVPPPVDPAGSETGPAPSGDPPVPPSGEGTDTGIVGEPTAMGQESDRAPADAARPGPSPAEGRRERGPSGWASLLGKNQQDMLWAGIGIAVVLLVLVGLGVSFFANQESPSTDEDTPATTVADTTSAASAATDSTASASSAPPADVTLGPSIPLTIVATADVRGIRIQRDEDIRRPYWIEEGEAQVFPFEQQVSIEKELGDVRLLLAGYPYPVQPQDTVGGLEITRARAQAFVDTLRGAPPTLSATPDTIPKGPPEQ